MLKNLEATEHFNNWTYNIVFNIFLTLKYFLELLYI